MSSAVEQFERTLDVALSRLRTLLDNSRRIDHPGEVQHTYDDKFVLVERVFTSSASAILQVLFALGLQQKDLLHLIQSAKTRDISIRFRGSVRCNYLREETEKVYSDVTEVTEIGAITVKERDYTKVTKHFHQLDFHSSLSIGAHTESNFVLCTRESSIELCTNSKSSPHYSRTFPSSECSLTWLFQGLERSTPEQDEQSPSPFQNLSDLRSVRTTFKINRASADCKTPRRNPQVETFLSDVNKLSQWCQSLKSSWSTFEHFDPATQNLDMKAILGISQRTFIPVLPFFEENGSNILRFDETRSEEVKSVANSIFEQVSSSRALPADLIILFADEHYRSLQEGFEDLAKTFPDPSRTDCLVSSLEAKYLTCAGHLQEIVRAATMNIELVEVMLLRQLNQALGKVVTAHDFDQYMNFHATRILQKSFQPHPFSYAIRQPGHSPEGFISFEYELNGENKNRELSQPVSTVVCWYNSSPPLSASSDDDSSQETSTSNEPHSPPPMQFSLSASIKVRFYGERFLHGFLSHSFNHFESRSLSLRARARQFSSFIMILGRIGGNELFLPKYSIIIKNKDDLKIPLMLETIPSAKAFKRAKKSLSPEQQRFADAYRSLQLESTLFGVLVIQVKPHLERLLNLPQNSLSKQLALTQDILELFTRYNVPSDLLSFDGNPEASLEEKLSTVQKYVDRVQRTIHNTQDEELEEAEMQKEYREAIEIPEIPPPPPQVAPLPPSPPIVDEEPYIHQERVKPKRSGLFSKLLSFFQGGSSDDTTNTDLSPSESYKSPRRQKLRSRKEDRYLEDDHIGGLANLLVAKSVVESDISPEMNEDCDEEWDEAEISPHADIVEEKRVVVSATVSQDALPNRALKSREVAAPKIAEPATKNIASSKAKAKPAARPKEVEKESVAKEKSAAEPIIPPKATPLPTTSSFAPKSSRDELIDAEQVPRSTTGHHTTSDLTTTSSSSPSLISPVDGTLEIQSYEFAERNLSQIEITEIPSGLDKAFESMDVDEAVHPSIIHVKEEWMRERQEGLLSRPVTQSLSGSEITSERTQATDLLDSLTRSDTVIKENINPIEKVERSLLIMASSIHGKSPLSLVQSEYQDSVQTFSPSLLLADQ